MWTFSLLFHVNCKILKRSELFSCHFSKLSLTCWIKFLFLSPSLSLKANDFREKCSKWKSNRAVSIKRDTNKLFETANWISIVDSQVWSVSILLFTNSNSNLYTASKRTNQKDFLAFINLTFRFIRWPLLS